MRKHRFGLIVPVVRQEQRVGPAFAGTAQQQAVSRFAGAGFHPACGHPPRQACVVHRAGDVQTRAQTLAKARILLRSFAPQAMLHMRRAHGKTVHLHQLANGAQQGNRIRPSAERYQQRRVGAQHLRALKRGFHGG